MLILNIEKIKEKKILFCFYFYQRPVDTNFLKVATKKTKSSGQWPWTKFLNFYLYFRWKTTFIKTIFVVSEIKVDPLKNRDKKFLSGWVYLSVALLSLLHHISIISCEFLLVKVSTMFVFPPLIIVCYKCIDVFWIYIFCFNLLTFRMIRFSFYLHSKLIELKQIKFKN